MNIENALYKFIIIIIIIICKCKNVLPSSIEYVNQVRRNLKGEKHVSTITGTQDTFQQKWHKILQSL